MKDNLVFRCFKWIFSRGCITQKDGKVICPKKGKALKFLVEVDCGCGDFDYQEVIEG